MLDAYDSFIYINRTSAKKMDLSTRLRKICELNKERSGMPVSLSYIGQKE